MGPRSQYLETVLTCVGDYYSPDFHRQLSEFREQLQQLIFAGWHLISLDLPLNYSSLCICRAALPLDRRMVMLNDTNNGH